MKSRFTLRVRPGQQKDGFDIFLIIRDWLLFSWFSSDSVALKSILECGTSTFKTDIDRCHRAAGQSGLGVGMESTVHLQIVLRIHRPERHGSSKIMKIKIFDRKNRKLHFSKTVFLIDCSCPQALRASGNFFFARFQPSQPYEIVPQTPKSDYQQRLGASKIMRIKIFDRKNRNLHFPKIVLL